MKGMQMYLIAVLLIGGLVHLFAPFGVNLISYLGMPGMWIQGLVGASLIGFGVKEMMK